MCANVQRLNFVPPQQRISFHDICYQPSALNFALVSKAVIANQPISDGCWTRPMKFVQHPVLTTFPPAYHPSSIPINKVSFTYAHLMTVEQTCNWILTLGAFKGWKEAPRYAENFRKKNITGMMLRELNHELLKFELGVLNSSHRIELIMTARQLFPSYAMLIAHATPRVPLTISGMHETDTESDLPVWKTSDTPSQTWGPLEINAGKDCEPYLDYYQVKKQDDSVQMDISPQQSFCGNWDGEYRTRSCAKLSKWVSSRRSTAALLNINESNLQKVPIARTRRSFCTEPDFTSEGISFNEKDLAKRGKTSRKSNVDLVKLGATSSTICSSTSSETSCATGFSKTGLPNDKLLLLTLPPEQVVRAGNIRNHFLKFKLVIRLQPLKRRNCWLIIFQSIEEAKRALSLRRHIGYNLAIYQKPESHKRPTPTSPMEYRVLSKVTIRSGKSLQGEIVGELYKNMIVTINKIKGRRARIIRNGNEPITVGWVSSHTVEGLPLLEQI